MKPLRLGVIGTGQAWRRLYEPALRRTARFEAAAFTDPAGSPAPAFGTVDDMVQGGAIDCALVLSPAALHSAHVLACAAHGVPVLVEKPPALSLAEVETWSGYASLVRPAFSRRYWPRYRHHGRNGHAWQFDLVTNPAGWGATTTDDPATDLLPHTIDLARWLSGEDIAAIDVASRTATRVSGQFALSGGGTFAWRVEHGGAYIEDLRLDGNLLNARSGIVARIGDRIARRPPAAISAITEMLDDWALALSGAAPARLPTFADARANVAALEQVLAAPIEGNA